MQDQTLREVILKSLEQSGVELKDSAVDHLEASLVAYLTEDPEAA